MRKLLAARPGGSGMAAAARHPPKDEASMNLQSHALARVKPSATLAADSKVRELAADQRAAVNT